jgi:ubiquinone/menaquinone biosynthesis C-methylase UbiE
VAKMSPVEKWIVNHASPFLSPLVLRPFLEHLELLSGAVLLELGCGAGQTALLVDGLFHPARFLVTDYDPGQVDEAKATFRKAYGDLPARVGFETADAARLPYPDGSFDAVLAFFVLHHLGDRMVDGLAEIDRVLKPHGKVVYAEVSRRGAIRDFLLRSRGHTFVYARKVLAFIDLVISRKAAKSAPVAA